MKTVRFELVALSIMVGWIVAAAGTITSLAGIPVIPPDAPVVVESEVVIPAQHASVVAAPSNATLALLVDGR